MHYKLVGFQQSDSIRRFLFERTGDRTATGTFTVVADLALARKFDIALQELPSLCSRLLESGADDRPAGTMFLGDAELTVHAATKLAAAKEDQAKRALRSHRSALASAIRTEKNRLSPGAAHLSHEHVRS